MILQNFSAKEMAVVFIRARNAFWRTFINFSKFGKSLSMGQLRIMGDITGYYEEVITDHLSE